jgi:hypothetical protein
MQQTIIETQIRISQSDLLEIKNCLKMSRADMVYRIGVVH